MISFILAFSLFVLWFTIFAGMFAWRWFLSIKRNACLIAENAEVRDQIANLWAHVFDEGYAADLCELRQKLVEEFMPPDLLSDPHAVIGIPGAEWDPSLPGWRYKESTE